MGERAMRERKGNLAKPQGWRERSKEGSRGNPPMSSLLTSPPRFRMARTQRPAPLRVEQLIEQSGQRARRPQRVFPDADNRATCLTEFPVHPERTSVVCTDLCSPVFPIGDRQWAFAKGTAMPEAAVDEQGQPSSGEPEVRTPHDRPCVHRPAADSASHERQAYFDLRRAVPLCPHSPHALASLRRAQDVHGLNPSFRRRSGVVVDG